MKRLAPILLMLCATLTARAQEDTLTILRKDYRNDDGRTVIVNKPLLQRLHKGNVQTVKLETPHNGFKVLKPHLRQYQNTEPTGCDGFLIMWDTTRLWFNSQADSCLPYRRKWTTDYLFRGLEYSDGIAVLRHHARVSDICEYECRGEFDDGNHEFPSSAICFNYADEYYYIPVDDDCWKDSVEIDLGDSVCLTMTVYRDRKGEVGEQPYAEVTDMRRIRTEGEIDTIGRVIGYGDTLYITHLDGYWAWSRYLTSDMAKEFGLSADEYYIVLNMNETFCKRMKIRFFRRVDYYNRGNRIWHEYLPLKNTGVQNPDFDNCTLWLRAKPHGFKE